MSEQHIPNWVGANPIRVATASPESIAQLGPLVRISQDAGSLSFCHTLTPTQARQLAHDLVELAAEAEAIAKGQA